MASKSVVRKKNTDLTNEEQIYACRTCGNSVAKNFCEVCGEKKLNNHDFSLKHFVEETFEGFTHFDNKFFRTARLLIFKPGQLTLDFCEGRRVPYIKPCPMFIICNILFFLLVGRINMFSQPLTSFFHNRPYTNFNTKKIILSMVKTDAEFLSLASEFNQRMGSESKAFLALFIPILALGSIAVNYRRRTYFSEHLVFGTHYFTFILILFTLSSLIITTPYHRWISPEQSGSSFDAINSFISLTLAAVYFGFASMRFYKVGWLRSILGAVVVTLVFMVSLMAYRMILFYKIIYSLQAPT